MPRRDFASFHATMSDDDIRAFVAPFPIEMIDRASHIVFFLCDSYDDATCVRAKFDQQKDEYEDRVREALDAESKRRYEEYLKNIDLRGPIETPATVINADGTKEQTAYRIFV